MSELDDLEYTPRRPWWILIVAVLVVALAAGGVAAAWVLQAPVARPERLVLGVQVQTADGTRAGWWEGQDGVAGAAIEVHDELHGELEALGFDVVARSVDGLGTDLAATSTEPERAAVALSYEAAWYVPVVLEVQSVTPIGEQGARVEVVAQPSLRIVPTLGEGGVVEVPEVLRVRAAGKTELEAIDRMRMELARWGGPPLMASLVEQPALARLRGGDGLELEEAAAASTLKPAFEHLKYREAALEKLQERARRADEAEAAAGLPAEARISPWHGWTSPLGPGPDGSVIVKDDQLRIDVPLGERKLQVDEVHETVVRIAADGSRTRLLDEYNFYSHPHVSRDGSTLVAIAEQRSVAMALLLVDLASGEVRRPFISDTLDLSGPKLSADASRLFFWSQACRDCPYVGRVMDTASGEQRQVLHPDGRRLTWPAWSPDSQTLYVGATDSDGHASILAVDVESGQERTVLGPRRIERIRDVKALPDGHLVASVRSAQGESQLVRVSPDGSQQVQVLHQGPHDSFVLSPDGTHLAAEIRGLDGWDLHVLDLDGGTMQQVTRGSMNEQVVGFTGDGERVIFYVEHRERETKQRYLTAYVVPAG